MSTETRQNVGIETSYADTARVYPDKRRIHRKKGEAEISF